MQQECQRSLFACGQDMADAIYGLLNCAKGINTQDLENAEKALASEANRLCRLVLCAYV